MDKTTCTSEDVTKLLFEQTTSRFDYFLNRINYINYKKWRNLKEKGILIVDKSKKEPEVQRFALNFKHQDYSSKNMAEVPLFLDSRSSRLIQPLDLIAFAIYRYIQHSDVQYYNIIRDNFDHDEEENHGL